MPDPGAASRAGTPDPGILRHSFGPGPTGEAVAWFTGAVLPGVADANLAHHRPHVPERLAAARDRVGLLTGTDPAAWHLMRQVHGAEVGTIGPAVAPGTELRGVDLLVTDLPDRPLVVLAADCLPILAAGRSAIGAAHAGWRGLVAGVPQALVAALAALGERPEDVRVVIGPGIGPCCYEVGPEVIAQVVAATSLPPARTAWGTPSIDLRRGARHLLEAAGVGAVADAGGSGGCTACDPRWFSHRRDPRAGRQAGIVVRRGGSPVGGAR